MGKHRDSKGRALRSGESQRENGQYMYRYTDCDGNRRTVYSWRLVASDRTPAGKKDSEALREHEKKIQKDLDDRIHIGSANTITLDDEFQTFMEIRADLKETTRGAYIELYKKHVSPVLGKRTLDNIRYSDIQRLYTSLCAASAIRPSTVQKINSILIQTFAIAVMDNLIRSNPAEHAFANVSKRLSLESEHRNALTIEETEILLNFVYSTNEFSRWGPLITVLLGTGLRIGEALGLTWSDCDFQNNLIRVTHALLYKPTTTTGFIYRISEPKTRSGMRTIPMVKDVRETLQAIKESQARKKYDPFVVDGYAGFIFLNNNGKVFTPAAVFDALQNIVATYNRAETFAAQKEERDAKLLPRFSAHILRHTFCTRLCEQEQDTRLIQDVMGHKNIRTTMEIYADVTESRKQKEFAVLESTFRIK
mgnify:FL=1